MIEDLGQEETATLVRVYNVYRAWIMQRARGVYLAHCSEDQHGTEEWDAFPTEQAARRWCSEWCQRSRLPWVQEEGRLFAEVRGELLGSYKKDEL